MGVAQKKKMEEDMFSDQMRRNEERQAQMQREIDEERKKLAEIEKRSQEEAAKRSKDHEEFMAKVKKQREEEQREREQLEVQKCELLHHPSLSLSSPPSAMPLCLLFFYANSLFPHRSSPSLSSSLV